MSSDLMAFIWFIPAILLMALRLIFFALGFLFENVAAGWVSGRESFISWVRS